MQINHILKFQELLSITINHGYYYNNRCNDFIFEVENETMHTIKEYGILVKQEQNKLILIIDVNKDFNHFCYLGEMELNFKIINKNPLFLNFTELPFISNQCIEFEQINERELLHAAENVTIENCHESISTNGINGKINLRLNKENELFGLSFSDKNKFLTIRHSINFKERNVYWKYLLYGSSKYMEDIESLYIYEKNQKNSITFISKGMVKLPNGRDGLLFISENSLPLKERPTKILGLYLNKNKNTENQLIKSLPCPNPTSVQYDKNEDKFFVQEFIFI